MSEKQGPKAASTMHGLDRIVLILDALRADPGATLAALARATGLSEPTTHRYLGALREHRLVTRDADGTYRLGIKLFELGHSALRDQDTRATALPYLTALRDQFGETAVMAEHSDHRLIVIAGVEGLHGVAKGAKVGEPDFWHSTSLGKAILAELDPTEAEEILAEQDLRRFTTRTLTTVEEVMAALRRVRLDGVAIDDEESEVGLRCIGTVVHDAAGTPRFAISVSGPTYRITADRVPEVAASVRDVGLTLARDLGWTGHPQPTGPAHDPVST